MRSNTRDSKIAALAARVLHRFRRLLLGKVVVGVVGAEGRDRELLLGLRYSKGRLSEVLDDILYT